MMEQGPVDKNPSPGIVERIVTKIGELPPENVDARWKVATVVAVTGLSVEGALLVLLLAVK